MQWLAGGSGVKQPLQLPGGGAGDHDRQQRASTLQGISQARTARNATGHEGLMAGSAPMPGRPRPPRGHRGCLRVGQRRLGGGFGEEGLLAERERATDQGPVAADGPVASDLEVGPAELALDLLVALLDSVAQPVQPHDAGEVGLLGAPGDGTWQVGQQIPGAVPRQAGRVGRCHDQPQPPVWAPATERRVGRPPCLGVAVAEAAGHPPATAQARKGCASQARQQPRPGYGPARRAPRSPCEA